MSKLILHKHQRALIQSFQKFQLDDMITEHENDKKRDQVLENLANLGDDDDVMEATKTGYTSLNEELLTDQQQALLKEIRDKFDPENVIADACILYEITHYKDSTTDESFWDTYMDFFELGNDEHLIRQDKLDLRALDRKTRLALIADHGPEAPSGGGVLRSQQTLRDGGGNVEN